MSCSFIWVFLDFVFVLYRCALTVEEDRAEVGGGAHGLPSMSASMAARVGAIQYISILPAPDLLQWIWSAFTSIQSSRALSRANFSLRATSWSISPAPTVLEVQRSYQSPH
jgi:hypothetical protein